MRHLVNNGSGGWRQLAITRNNFSQILWRYIAYLGHGELGKHTLMFDSTCSSLYREMCCANPKLITVTS